MRKPGKGALARRRSRPPTVEVPAEGYFDQRPHTDELWRLLYHLRLIPTTTGLVYRLSSFEYAYGLEDTSGGGTLEELLLGRPAQQPDLAAFHN
jgi:hypothetical protein